MQQDVGKHEPSYLSSKTDKMWKQNLFIHKMQLANNAFWINTITPNRIWSENNEIDSSLVSVVSHLGDRRARLVGLGSIIQYQSNKPG